MKILIIGPANPYRGGIAALNERLATQLLNEGHDVEIISFSLQYPKFIFPGKTQYTNALPPKGIKISRLINSINPFNWIKVGLILKKKKADLVLVRFWLPIMAPSTGTICKILKLNRKSKVIAIVDNLLPHESRIGDRLFTQYFISQTDGLLAMSECVFNDLDIFRKNQPKKLSPHPIYDNYGEVILKEDSIRNLNLDISFNYILFFGFIRDYKGLDILLEAMADPILDKLNIKLIVAGEFYSNEDKYKNIIEKLDIRDKVVLHTEYIPDHEVNQYFCAASLITQPYKSATQSGVTQIGYHFNKPMLVTNVGGLSEIIEDGKCGYVVNPDPSSISKALFDFFENKRESMMVEEVKIAKQKFSWNNFTKSIFEINNLFS
jgi:glycosyltransferase involved in cell wall biosynthesis